MNTVIGNIIALIASSLNAYSGLIKTKLKIIYIQTIALLFFVVSNFILGGITGAINNILNCIRNILYYKNKLGLKEKIVISIISIILSVVFNTQGLIGFLPLIVCLLYIWLMNVRDVVKFKLLTIITMILWFIYDLQIKSYTSMIFDFATVVTNFISIICIVNKKK